MNKSIKAIQFVTEVHRGQIRKGKPDVPYITHPFGVGLLLAQAGADEDIVIAGLLHDTIEDCKPYGSITKELIGKEFGEKIANMVNDVTEQDKSLPWAERKRLALDHVATMHPDSLLVKTADVLHNMSEQLEDYKKEGDAMFAKFNAGKEQQLERYTKLVKALEVRDIKNPLLPILEAAFRELKTLWQ